MEQAETIFQHIDPVAKDPIFTINALFNEDPRPDKVNLTIGYLASPEGSFPVILESVKEATLEIVKTERTKNYLPISGDKGYVEGVRNLIFKELAQERTVGLGTAGGTAAIRLVAEFVYRQLTHRVCLSNPTWANHNQIFHALGFEIDYYPYEMGHESNFHRVVDHFAHLPERTLVLFQPMSHNPTGVDFTLEEWKELSFLCKQRKLIPFFDSAYQGLGMGFYEDVEPIAVFIRDGHEVFVSHSFSKSMGLYGERVGAAFVVMNSLEHKDNVMNRMQMLTRTQYSNPPRHGESLAAKILLNEERKNRWMKEVDAMRGHVNQFRQKFSQQFQAISGKDGSYISKGHGFFCQLGMTKEQVERLKNEFGVYVANGARINLAALNEKNLDPVMKAIQGVM